MYWHNGRSLGHTAESAKIATALLESSDETYVSGVTGAYRGLDMLPDRMDLIKLPAFVNFDRSSGWAPATRSDMDIDEVFTLRAEMIDIYLAHYRPDILIVNHLPFGAEGEMRKALASTRSGKRVLTLRGVLFDRDKTRREYFTEEITDWIADNFDAISVHTDPTVFRLDSFYEVPDVLRDRIVHTGYLAERSSLSIGETREKLDVGANERLIVAAMGGGQGALPIWRELLQSFAERSADFDRVVAFTGPYLESGAFAELSALAESIEWLDLRSYTNDMPAWMVAADLFVGAAGSSMLGEILSTGVNSVVIPRQVREPEQRLHSAMLAERKLVRVCDLPEVLNGCIGPVLDDALSAPLSLDMSVELDGASRYPALLEGLL